MHANIPTKVGTLAIALSQALSFRRYGVVPSCVSSCERKACSNNETNVRLRNLRTTTPQNIPKHGTAYHDEILLKITRSWYSSLAWYILCAENLTEA